jgi:hypothetical protein
MLNCELSIERIGTCGTETNDKPDRFAGEIISRMSPTAADECEDRKRSRNNPATAGAK